MPRELTDDEKVLVLKAQFGGSPAARRWAEKVRTYQDEAAVRLCVALLRYELRK